MSKSLKEKLNLLDKASLAFNKKKGKTTSGRIAKVEELKDKLKVKFLETPSIRLNKAIGGGIPRGRTTIVAGNQDSGKTFLLLETIKLNQEKDPNFIGGWLESEGSLSVNTLEEIGIDLERFWYLEVDREGAAEEALNNVETILLSGSVDMLVVNSLKCLVPKEELKGSMDKLQVGLQARMNSKMMRKFTPILKENETSFVIIQQLTTEIGKIA